MDHSSKGLVAQVTDNLTSDGTTYVFDNEIFGNDYIHFSKGYLTPDRTRSESQLIANLSSLRKGGTVLDVGCGHGRISNELARQGYDVTGIDMNEIALNEAAKSARNLGVNVKYIHSDLVSSKNNETYDCVLSWYTSFGYFDDDVNKNILKKMYFHTKPGGCCLIEHINRDLALKNFQPNVIYRKGTDFMLDSIEFDSITNRSHRNRTYVRNGEVRTSKYQIRLFTFSELADWMKMVGYSTIKAYGSNGEQFKINSKRMIAVATK